MMGCQRLWALRELEGFDGAGKGTGDGPKYRDISRAGLLSVLSSTLSIKPALAEKKR